MDTLNLQMLIQEIRSIVQSHYESAIYGGPTLSELLHDDERIIQLTDQLATDMADASQGAA
jgi:hypothetical protein